MDSLPAHFYNTRLNVMALLGIPWIGKPSYGKKLA